MTIETLSYIHRLLKCEEEKLRKITYETRRAYHDAADAADTSIEESKELAAQVAALEIEYKTASAAWGETRDALTDFNNHDWR